MNLDNHPFSHINNFLIDDNIELELSIYEYLPQTIMDTRKYINIKSSEFNKSWFTFLINDLEENREIAFHSIIKKNGRNYHFPMIDFCCTVDHLDYAKETLNSVLGNKIAQGLLYFDSGRSLHAYGSHLMTHKKWVEFMGKILLANLPDKPQIVDTRWVGHRLLGGFASLRWSSNSNHYLKMPSRL